MENIYSSIEILSKEKGIDTQIVLDAVKDALLIAARKHFRTTEELDRRTGRKHWFHPALRPAESGRGSNGPFPGNDAQ